MTSNEKITEIQSLNEFLRKNTPPKVRPKPKTFQGIAEFFGKFHGDLFEGLVGYR